MPLAVSLCAMLAASDQGASDQAAAPAKKGKPKLRDNKPTSSNATVNLVNLLVKQGVLKEDQAQGLIKQAEDEAYVSREAAKDATAKADDAAKAATVAAAAANPPGTKHVSYVPEVVKRELREEIKKEVMAKAEKENWASPGMYPEWAQRIHFYGDFRMRYQGNFFPGGNDQQDAVDFNAINTGSPFDLSSTNFPPTYDASQNREAVKLRARLGMDADLSNGLTAGMRIATGSDNSPVSTNQTLGGGTGEFSKYSLWLDRAYLKWQTPNFAISTGRFDNPFFSPTDLVWYQDLAFDGVAAQAKYEVAPGITPFGVIGAFPIFNTALNAGISTDPTANASGPTELPSHDKWLFGVQGGVIAEIQKDITLKVGVAYYDFTNVQGEVSTPCLVTSSADACDTDDTRPTFAQKGNSYIALRNLIATPENTATGILVPDLEYFGLASQFRPLVVSGQLDFAEFNPVHIILDGEYVNNTAFDRSYLSKVAVNNFAPTSDGSQGIFDGGNQGWLGRVTVGDKEIKHLWDWNVNVGYKYLESDATLDAFTDPDFGLGGTNLKGYFLGGNLGLGENVWGTLRWMSANNISGFPYAVDVLQVDLNARF
jgi:Putative porin